MCSSDLVAVQRRQLSITMTNDVFLAQFRQWVLDLRRLAARWPATGGCTLATAMELWLWTLNHLQKATDADCNRLYQSSRQGVCFPLADALCWLLAARAQLLDVLELQEKGPANPALADGLPGLLAFLASLSQVQCARAAGEVGRICAELVFGYNRHPSWEATAPETCFTTEELAALEGVIPGFAGAALAYAEVTEPTAPAPTKAGPCASLRGKEEFVRLRVKLDGCLTGARLAKDAAAEVLTKVTIPEALDYPV